MATNKLDPLMTDPAILNEIGQRLARLRVDSQLTQANLAEKAGISKRTIERLESGESAQLSSLIRILRVLNLLPGLEALLPQPGPRPMELLKLQGKVRRRASSPRAPESTGVRESNAWTWKDDTSKPES